MSMMDGRTEILTANATLHYIVWPKSHWS